MAGREIGQPQAPNVVQLGRVAPDMVKRIVSDIPGQHRRADTGIDVARGGDPTVGAGAGTLDGPVWGEVRLAQQVAQWPAVEFRQAIAAHPLVH